MGSPSSRRILSCREVGCTVNVDNKTSTTHLTRASIELHSERAIFSARPRCGSNTTRVRCAAIRAWHAAAMGRPFYSVKENPNPKTICQFSKHPPQQETTSRNSQCMRIPLPLSCFFSSLFCQSITTTCVGGCMALHCTCPQRCAASGVRRWCAQARGTASC